MLQGNNGRIELGQGSASPGQTVNVKAPGCTKLTVFVDGTTESFEVDLNSKGEGTIKVPQTSSMALIITDGKWPSPTSIELPIIQGDMPDSERVDL